MNTIHRLIDQLINSFHRGLYIDALSKLDDIFTMIDHKNRKKCEMWHNAVVLLTGVALGEDNPQETWPSLHRCICALK